MRPIRLEIEGIHSFKQKQNIDFDYVSKHGIFGIFGETGSGKSTILDSIILSIYGKINRSKINSDFINSKSKVARVCLLFSSKDGNKLKKYEVERVFKKQIKNTNNVDQNAQLFEITSLGRRQIADGVYKVDEMLVNLLGMGETEFSKCIALPQGEFAGFLKAKPTERINIIGNIFDLNQYGQELYEKAAKRWEVINSKLSRKLGSIESIDKVTSQDIKNIEEELAEKRKELKIQDLKITELKKRLKVLDDEFLNTKRIKVLENELKILEKDKLEIKSNKELLSNNLIFEKIKDKYERREEVDELVQKEEKNLSSNSSLFEENNNLLQSKLKIYNDNLPEIEDEIDKGLEKYAYLNNLKNNKSKADSLTFEKSKCVLKIKELKLKKESLESDINNLDKQLEKNNNEILTKQNIIDKNREKVDFYNDLSEIKHISKQIEVIEDFSVTLDNFIDGKNRESKQAREDIFALFKTEKEIKKSINKTTEIIDSFLKVQEKNSYERLRYLERKLFAMTNVDSKIKFLKTIISEYLLENDEHLQNIENLNESTKIIENNIIKQNEICLSIENEITNEQNEREGYLGQNVLSIMLEHLEIGDECPVCRGDVIQKHAFKKSDLSVFDNNIVGFKNKLKTTLVEKEKLVFQLSGFQTRIEDEKKAININLKKISKVEKAIEKELIKFVDINEHSETQFAGLFESTKSIVQKLEKLILNEEELKEKLDKIKTQRTEFGTKNILYTEVAEELTGIYEIFQKIKAEKQMQIINYTGKEKDLHESLKELMVFAKQSEQASKEIELLLIDKQTLLKDLSDKQIEYAKVSSEYDNSNEKFENFSTEINSLIEPIKKETYSELDDYILKFKERLDKKREKLKKDKADLDNTRIEVSKIENSMKINATLIDNYNSELFEIDQSLISTMNELGINQAKELEKYKLTEKQKNELNLKIKKFESEIFVVTAELEKLKEKTENQNFDEVEYNSLIQNIDSITAIQNESREIIGKFSIKLENKKEDLRALTQLEQEIKELSQKLDVTKELRDLLRGRSLMEYVAEEYIDDITKIASQKLMMLNYGNYSLVCENKEFFVIDNMDDGYKRSVGTLSGGETFIVSLALALAISEGIIQNSQKSMDFFFLDEGFGTLDPDLREAIIGSLQKLNNQNLTIGLISHVEELKNTVKSKILVKKRSDGSGSTIEYDYTI